MVSAKLASASDAALAMAYFNGKFSSAETPEGLRVSFASSTLEVEKTRELKGWAAVGRYDKFWRTQNNCHFLSHYFFFFCPILCLFGVCYQHGSVALSSNKQTDQQKEQWPTSHNPNYCPLHLNLSFKTHFKLFWFPELLVFVWACFSKDFFFSFLEGVWWYSK